MLKMIQLVQNENMKLYRKIGTWVMIGLIVIALIGVSSLNCFIDGTMSEKQIKEALEKGKVVLNQPGITEVQKDSFKKEIRLLEFSLQNKISPERVEIFKYSIRGVLPLIALMVLIVAASIIGKEFSDGTIKLLLIRPVSRSTILLSKYITALLFSLAMLVLHFVISSVVLCILFKPTLLLYMYQDILNQYGYFSVELLVVLTLAFMISTVFRNQGLAIGLTLFLYFTGEIIVRFIARYFSGAKYLLFANLNLSQYSGEVVNNELFAGLQGMTLAFSIKVLAVYYISFLFITWYSFNKRDVSL